MQFVPHLRKATDSEAVIELHSVGGQLPTGLSGELYGPTCEFAKTLASQFSVSSQSVDDSIPRRSHVLVTEPCYWTPELPFLYTLRLQWRDDAGNLQQSEQTIGVRRLAPRRGSLYWESRRIVLRGAAVPCLDARLAAATREAGMTLIVPQPSEAQWDLADRRGIAMVADLRNRPADLADQLERFSARPSAAIMLLDCDQGSAVEGRRIPPQANLACVVYAGADAAATDQSLPTWANLLAVELKHSQRPPAGLQIGAWPLIALRPGDFADLHEARAQCDKLQADLAPQFNLAGYFVLPSHA